MTDPVPHAMYQAVTDKLTGEIRENLQLRAEVIALTAEVARLNGELANMFNDPAINPNFNNLGNATQANPITRSSRLMGAAA
jgi:hypothetical protein